MTPPMRMASSGAKIPARKSDEGQGGQGAALPSQEHGRTVMSETRAEVRERVVRLGAQLAAILRNN